MGRPKKYRVLSASSAPGSQFENTNRRKFMPQFLIDSRNIQGNTTTLTGNEAKHLIKVLRYKKGDRVFLSDGQYQYVSVIESLSGKTVNLKLLDRKLLQKAAPSPILGISLLKHDHLELVLQKGVELGVGEFILFISERTIPHYHESATPKKLARFEKIAMEAAKQSGMITPPKIDPVISFEALVKNFDGFSGVMLAWEEEKESSFNTVFQTLDPTKLLLIIGPEGGFTKEEVALAEKNGAKIVTLGRQILRAETAAITTLALCQYELGNL